MKVFKKSKSNEIINEDMERMSKIQDLIKLHIHIRILMMSEHMSMSIDFHWRRMLDDSKESMVRENFIHSESIFDHIKNNICKNLKVNGKEYPHDYLYKIYNGTSEQKVMIDPDKIQEIRNFIDGIVESNEHIPSLLTHAVKIAGNRFL